jgi:5-methylcytosine-specific restriction endonuclease McrA
MRLLRHRWLFSVTVLAVSGYFTHWLTVGMLALPVLADLRYYARRDRRYRFVWWPHTRRCWRLFFLGRRKVAVTVRIPVAQRASAHWPAWMRAAIIARDQHCQCEGCPRCNGRAMCGPCAVTYDLQIDHLIPRSRGGATTVRNGRAMCGPCNRFKSDRMPVLSW